MLYTSKENKKMKDLKKLRQKKYRDQTDCFLIEGLDIVNEAATAGYLKEVYLLEGNDIALNAPKSYISAPIAKQLSTQKSSDYIFGLCAKKKANFTGERILLLEEIQDPGNLGAILRSALAFNIDTVLLYKTCDLYHEKVIRSSKGAFFHLNIMWLDDLSYLQELAKDYLIIGTNKNASQTIKSIVNIKKFVIIFGNEGRGISPEAHALTHQNVAIPINPACESLNVAVAAGILLYKIDIG